MTPVTSISALTTGRVTEPPRSHQESRTSHHREAAELRQGSRMEKLLEAAGVDESTVANLRADMEALFDEHAQSGESSAALHEKVKAMFNEHGLDFDRMNGRDSVVAYGKIVTQDQLGQIQLADPPAQGSLRQLLRAVEESRAPEAPLSRSESTLQAMFGIDITV